MKQKGFTLVELMVIVAIAGVLLGLGLNSFRTMMDSTNTKSAAESLLTGLRLARSEAIKRNAPMRFQLVSSLTLANCQYAATSAFWIVSQTNSVPTDGTGQVGRHTLTDGTVVPGYCEAAPFTPPDQPNPCNPAPTTCDINGQPAGCRPLGNPTCSNEPYIAFKSPPRQFSSTTVAGLDAGGNSATVVTFGPLGQVLNNVEGTTPIVRINISSTNADAKAWRVTVTPGGGGVKLCDPALDSSLIPPPPLAC